MYFLRVSIKLKFILYSKSERLKDFQSIFPFSFCDVTGRFFMYIYILMQCGCKIKMLLKLCGCKRNFFPFLCLKTSDWLLMYVILTPDWLSCSASPWPGRSCPRLTTPSWWWTWSCGWVCWWPTKRTRGSWPRTRANTIVPSNRSRITTSGRAKDRAMCFACVTRVAWSDPTGQNTVESAIDVSRSSITIVLTFTTASDSGTGKTH